jgi:pectin methylesterase-like acyl-CoA thioesterase
VVLSAGGGITSKRSITTRAAQTVVRATRAMLASRPAQSRNDTPGSTILEYFASATLSTMACRNDMPPSDNIRRSL